jgi:excinuclease ABC subunit B
LVAILDADKEGFLRSEVSLIQTMGRAARNTDSRVILYADTITGSIKRATDEVKRRREIQLKWNKDNGINPTTIIKPIREDVIDGTHDNSQRQRKQAGFSILMDAELADIDPNDLMPEQKQELKKVLERRMKEAAKILDFEGATFYRDYLKKLS